MENVRQEVKIMPAVTVRAVFIFLMAAGVRATTMEDADVSRLVSESLHTYNQFKKISGEMKAATSDLDKQLNQLREDIKWFKQPAFDEKMVKRFNDSIADAQNNIAIVQAWIETAKITDPNERAKLAQKYENERKRLLAEEMEAGKPFRERIKQLRREVEDKQEPFEKAMKVYCLLPQSEYPAAASTYVSTPFHTGELTYKWLDSNGKQLGWAWIRLKDKPEVKDDAEMLDDTYYVSEHWSHKIVVWAGYFRVNFNVHLEWVGREKIAILIKDFIDLDGLAEIDPTRNDSNLNALAMASLACSDRYHRISRERSDATGQLRAERVKVKMLKSRLKKPPADSEQLKKDRSLIDHYKKEIRATQNRLEVGRVRDPNERTARIVLLEAQKKKLDAEKKKIARPYDDKIRKLKGGFKDKEAALNDAMKRYCLTGGKAYPGVTELLTETKFYRGRTRCIWKDADGKRLCRALLELRNRPVLPQGARMLDGLYWVEHSSGNTIRLWVGKFSVYFEVNKKQWQGEEKVADALKHFIDLAGLAKII
jgi:DNA-binding transcriptional regulator YbjK